MRPPKIRQESTDLDVDIFDVTLYSNVWWFLTQTTNITAIYVTPECYKAQQKYLDQKDDVSWIEKMNVLEYDCIVKCGEACSSFCFIAPSIILMTLFTLLIK